MSWTCVYSLSHRRCIRNHRRRDVTGCWGCAWRQISVTRDMYRCQLWSPEWYIHILAFHCSVTTRNSYSFWVIHKERILPSRNRIDWKFSFSVMFIHCVSEKMHQLWNGIARNYKAWFRWHLAEIFKILSFTYSRNIRPKLHQKSPNICASHCL